MAPVTRLPTSSSTSSSSSNAAPSSASGDVTPLSWSLTGPSSWRRPHGRSRGGVGLPRPRDLEQLLHPLGRPRSSGQPVDSPVVVDLHDRGLGPGFVGAQHLDEAAVTGGGGVGHHDAVGRLLLLSHSHQSELDGHCSPLWSVCVWCRRVSEVYSPPPGGIPGRPGRPGIPGTRESSPVRCSSRSAFTSRRRGVTRPLPPFLPFLPRGATPMVFI